MAKEKSLIESLAEMGQDDPEFRKEMDKLFIETLDEFLAAYNEGIQQHNLEKLGFAIHKIKFAVKMYAIEDMHSAAEQGREMLVANASQEQLNECAKLVGELCQLHRNKIAQGLN